MPIYEYECVSCSAVTEADRKPSDRKKRKKCAACGSMRTHLIPSRGSFSLQGGGWYATDYKVQGGGKKKE